MRVYIHVENLSKSFKWEGLKIYFQNFRRGRIFLPPTPLGNGDYRVASRRLRKTRSSDESYSMCFTGISQMKNTRECRTVLSSPLISVSFFPKKKPYYIMYNGIRRSVSRRTFHSHVSLLQIFAFAIDRELIKNKIFARAFCPAHRPVSSTDYIY